MRSGRRLPVITAITLALVAAGCASSGNESSDADSDDTVVATTTAPASENEIFSEVEADTASEADPASPPDATTTSTNPAASDTSSSDTTISKTTTIGSVSTTTTATDAVADADADTSTTTVAPAVGTTTTPPAADVGPTTTTAFTPGPVADSGSFDLGARRLTLGLSVEGREIVAERYGTVGGRRVLVIGVIHGNEDAGVAILDQLRARADGAELRDGYELWLVESMNPDGQAVQDRHNANQVDLNRNFPHEWGPIGQPGDGQYAGTGPASEPETQAMVAFISQLRPDIAVWYHQDANLIIPSTGRQGRIRARYAELTGLPLAECCGTGGVYTGIAATWARVTLADQEAVPFIVELPGGDLTIDQVLTHTDAVETIAVEG